MKVLGFVVLFALVASIFTLPLQRENEPKSLTEVEELEIDANVNTWLEKVEDIAEFPDDIKDVWQLIKAMIKELLAKKKVEIDKLIAKYRPHIIAIIKKFKNSLIKEGKDLAVDLINTLIKIIMGLGDNVLDDETDLSVVINTGDVETDNGIREWWEMIKKFVKEYLAGKMVDVKKLIEKYQPQVVAFLKHFAELIVRKGKSVAIDLLTEIIRIIIGWGNVNDEQFEMVEVNGKVDDWFKKVWAKITKFFQDLGEKIKEAFKDFGIDMKDFGKKVKEAFDKLGAKIKEAFDKVFSKEKREQIKQMFKHYADVVVAEFKRVVMKYKDLIIEALMKDGKVIVAEGQKLLIAALDAAVKLIVDIIHKIVGNEVLYDDLPEEANINIKDLWEKIKQFIKAYLKDKEEDFEKMVTKYKPRLIELLKNFGKTLAHEGKGLAIDLLGDLIKIIIGWGSNDEPMELLDDEVAEVNGKVDDWFKKVWAKITKFFQDLGEKIKVAFKDFGIDMKDFGKKIKEAFDKLGAKIKEIFNKVFPANIKEQIKKMFQHYGEVIVAEFNRVVKKYLDLIVSALTKDWKVIFEEGQKLLIAALDEGVKLIINIIKKITGNDVLFDDIDDEANGIKDIWEIIKKMVKAFLKKRKKTLKRW